MTRRKGILRHLAGTAVAAAAAVILFSVFRYRVEVADSVKKSFVSCAVNVLPTLFPFMVISSIIVKMRLTRPIEKILARPFEKLFGLPPSSVTPYLLGLTCSFPVGVISAAEAFGDGLLTSDEAERTAALSNNTGPGYIVAIAGISLANNVNTGVLIYVSEIISSLVAGAVLYHGCFSAIKRPGLSLKEKSTNIGKAISESISGAVSAAGTVVANVVFFSLLSRSISLTFRIDNEYFRLLSSVLFEFTEGVRESLSHGGAFGVALSALSVCSGGLSVLCQSAAVASTAGFSVGKMAIFKLFQGTAAAAICLAVSHFFPIFLPKPKAKMTLLDPVPGTGLILKCAAASFCLIFSVSKALRRRRNTT